MPFKSKAQAAYMNIHKKEISAKVVNEFNAASKGLKLPMKVVDKSKKRKSK
jgi:hypothetical protein